MTKPFDVHIDYDGQEKQWVAVYLREDNAGVLVPWYLDGAIVGLDETPGGAVENLIGLSSFLIEFGSNFLMVSELPLADRWWLFHNLDGGLDPEENQRLWEALQKAERGV